MIKREFWEKIAEVWAKKEEIEIPDIGAGPDVPDDLIDLDSVENWDDLLKDLLGPDTEDEMDFGDLLSGE